MAKNTHLSDINELAVCFFLGEQHWSDPIQSGTFGTKAKLVLDRKPEIINQVERGRAMAQAVRAHLNNYEITEIHWVGRGNCPVICPVISDHHPMDILLRLQYVKDIRDEIAQAGLAGCLADSCWFGISCKSTNGYGDVGYKNPGLGTIATSLGPAFANGIIPLVPNETEEFRVCWNLSKNAKLRKLAIRADATLLGAARICGSRILNEIRDRILYSLMRQSQPFLQAFLKNVLLDCDESGTTPRYIKVTGFGNPLKGYSANIHDPFQDSLNGHISVELVGNEGIGFRCLPEPIAAVDTTIWWKAKKICLLRAKFESEKMASTVKFSVDPWV